MILFLRNFLCVSLMSTFFGSVTRIKLLSFAYFLFIFSLWWSARSCVIIPILCPFTHWSVDSFFKVQWVFATNCNTNNSDVCLLLFYGNFVLYYCISIFEFFYFPTNLFCCLWVQQIFYISIEWQSKCTLKLNQRN
jgi:hypothetical protein